VTEARGEGPAPDALSTPDALPASPDPTPRNGHRPTPSDTSAQVPDTAEPVPTGASAAASSDSTDAATLPSDVPTEPTAATASAPTEPATPPSNAPAEPSDPILSAPQEDRPRRPSPAADLRVAHVLLRCGNVMPARVHLETLAGREQLDAVGLLDLAESRWRTGDLGGAGEAVVAYLETGGTDPLSYVIAAEASAAVSRPGEARKLARRALETLDAPLDAVFAGQPRSGVWPHDPGAPAQPAGTLFSPAPTDATHGGRIGLTADAASPAAPAVAAATAAKPAASAGAPTVDAEPEQSLWDAAADANRPDVKAELDAARTALQADDRRTAAVRLAVVLRLSPSLAPAVLDLVGQLPGPDFDLLRGDALRLVGHEAAAERAFAAAADALRQDQTTTSEDEPTRSSE
jgi:hypothetical protein